MMTMTTPNAYTHKFFPPPPNTRRQFAHNTFILTMPADNNDQFNYRMISW